MAPSNSSSTARRSRRAASLVRLALVEDRPRVAPAIVSADTDVVRVDRKRFQFLIQQTPYFSRQLMGIMAERLRRMNQRL